MSVHMTDRTLISLNPATKEAVGETALSTPAQVDIAIVAAHAALFSWRQDQATRQGLLHRIAAEVHRHADALSELLTLEQGKPRAEARQEIWIAAEAFTAAADVQWETQTQQQVLAGGYASVHHVPFGVVAAIVPWNFPIYLAAAKIAPALVAGNTVVVKPAESVSLVVSKFVEILQSVLPQGVVEVVVGGPETGRRLVEDRRIRKVTFTGSTQIGKEIIRQSADTVTPLTLELGGNDPAIILDDADLGHTAERIAAGAFLNAGQMCIAPKRIYVPLALRDELAAALVAEAQARVVGDGAEPNTTMGPLHNQSQHRFVNQLIADAVQSGGRLAAGGKRLADLPGYFLEPTVLVDVDDQVDVVRLEQFGPVLPIVSYLSLNAVLETIDAQDFGLGASVWSADLDRAAQVATAIDAGTVWINKHNALDVNLPFGGTKESGFGREGGLAGVQDFLTTRVIN